MHLYTVRVGFASYGGFNMPTNFFNQGKPWVRLGLQITRESERERARWILEMSGEHFQVICIVYH
jgi:hypothetical protein